MYGSSIRSEPKSTRDGLSSVYSNGSVAFFGGSDGSSGFITNKEFLRDEFNIESCTLSVSKIMKEFVLVSDL